MHLVDEVPKPLSCRDRWERVPSRQEMDVLVDGYPAVKDPGRWFTPVTITVIHGHGYVVKSLRSGKTGKDAVFSLDLSARIRALPVPCMEEDNRVKLITREILSRWRNSMLPSYIRENVSREIAVVLAADSFFKLR